MLNTKTIDYNDGDTTLEAYYSHDESTHSKPVVLVIHDWSGKNTFACQKADALATLGYVGLAIDMYGKGKIGTTKDEKSALMSPLVNDRTLLKSRLEAAVLLAKSLPHADTTKIGAIGFCFGGLCALDLARFHDGISGVVSFHGLFMPPSYKTLSRISAKVLALHGFDDPMVKPEDVIAFSQEMTSAKADWQLHMYGQTMHAFTNPEANDPAFGTVYNSTADQRAQLAMKNFFNEVFA